VTRRTIFISYAREDEAWKDRLLAQLSALLHSHDVELWQDRDISSGSLWRERIDDGLQHAVAAVLLISPHFLRSDFIRETEVPLLLEAKAKRDVLMIPVIVHECAWETVGWIEERQVCLIRDRPLDEAPAAEAETALKGLAARLDAYLDDAPSGIDAEAKRTNLPPPRTNFVGRAREQEDLKDLLRSRERQLVTISGGPGLGKTRLARQVALDLLDFYPGGCWFADLADAVTLTGIAHAIAQAFDISVASGQVSDQEAIVEILRHRGPLLLILDNFEQVVQFADASIGFWLERLPNVTFLVTSRQLLALEGEQEQRLESLALPPREWEGEDPSALLRYESVQLFVDRARAAWPRFVFNADAAAAIARICVQLDGIPLALELTAAMARMYSAPKIADELQKKLPTLKSQLQDIPNRHKTLYAAIDWSLQLLKPWEQHAFLQLCIFRGGFFLDAAEKTVDLTRFPDAPDIAEVVLSLYEKSLLTQVQVGDEHRFGMLVSIADYGRARWQKLQSDAEEEALARRWAAYYIPYVRAWSEKVHTIEGVRALDLLTLELENVFAIQDWFLAHDQPVIATEAILAFTEVMALRGPARLRVPRLQQSLNALGGAGTELLRVRLLTALSAAHWSVGEWNEASERADEAVELSVGHRSHPAVAALRQQARIRIDRGYLRRGLVSLSRAKDMYEELEGARRAAMINGDLAGIYDRLGDLLRAIALTDEAVEIARSIGDDFQLAVFLNRKGLALWHHGLPCEALEAIEEAERINTTLGALAWVGGHRTNEGLALVDLDELDRALERFTSADSIHRKLGTLAWAAVNLGGRGRALMMRNGPGDLESALRLFVEAGELSRRVYYPENISFHAGDMGRCLFLLGRYAEARRAVREAISLERVVGACRDLRHFGNLVTFARIARQLGLAEECEEAVLRARELLAAGLDVSASHRVRRVREDVSALDGLVCGSPPREWRVVALLRKHGRRPPAASELEMISRAVADSFAETSYEYPWNGLEADLRTLGASSFRLFAYGSLVNRESASRDFPNAGERSVPALAFGVVRLFEYDMPDVVRARFYPRLRADDPERASLNIHVTGFLTDVANGVVIDVAIDEVTALREREVGYDLRPIVCIDWSEETPAEPRIAFVLSAPNRLWKDRPLTNRSLQPLRPYLRMCLAGAETCSKAFAAFWRDTTFLGDGETTVSV
jgi:predicted ATPase/tetratricopeptide (TPR) repeat protein